MPILDTGDACPDFELPDADGRLLSLAELKGRPFVLYFYPKADTSGCTSQALAFTSAKADYDALGVPVIGISPDPVAKLAKFRDKHALTVRLLSDEEKTLLQAFGVWGEKSMYGRKYMGVDRTTALIDTEGRIAHLWPKVKVPGHAQAVLEEARKLTGDRKS